MRVRPDPLKERPCSVSQSGALYPGFRGRRRSGLTNELGDVADLLPDEQAELVTKLRFGIGLERLLGDSTEVRHVRRETAAVTPPREPDDGTYARAAALGIGAGRRGQWLRR